MNPSQLLPTTSNFARMLLFTAATMTWYSCSNPFAPRTDKPPPDVTLEPAPDATQPEIVSSMWRFSIAASTWEHVEGPTSTHPPHAVEWPAAREQAAVAPGVMFGGLENSISGGECVSAFTAGNNAMGPTPSRNTLPFSFDDGPPLLSGLWRWESGSRARW